MLDASRLCSGRKSGNVTLSVTDQRESFLGEKRFSRERVLGVGTDEKLSGVRSGGRQSAERSLQPSQPRFGSTVREGSAAPVLVLYFA